MLKIVCDVSHECGWSSETFLNVNFGSGRPCCTINAGSTRRFHKKPTEMVDVLDWKARSLFLCGYSEYSGDVCFRSQSASDVVYCTNAFSVRRLYDGARLLFSDNQFAYRARFWLVMVNVHWVSASDMRIWGSSRISDCSISAQ